MERLGTWLLVALAVVVFGIAGYVIVHNDDVPQGGQTPSTPALAGGTSSPRDAPPTGSAGPVSGSPSDSLVAAGSTSPASGAEPVVAFVGDDWTTGKGASAKAKRFTTLVSADLHLHERNVGIAQAGYAKNAPGGQTFASEIDAVVAANPAVVVVTGGRNDDSDDPATAAEHAKDLFTTLHQKLPDAVLVAVAPMWGDSDEPQALTALSEAVRSGVTAAGGTYLDLPDPIHGHPEFMADDADPNDKGYAAIAAALEPALQPLIPST